MIRYKELKKENENLKTELESMEAAKDESQVWRQICCCLSSFALPKIKFRQSVMTSRLGLRRVRRKLWNFRNSRIKLGLWPSVLLSVVNSLDLHSGPWKMRLISWGKRVRRCELHFLFDLKRNHVPLSRLANMRGSLRPTRRRWKRWETWRDRSNIWRKKTLNTSM